MGQAQKVFTSAGELALVYAGRGGVHPLESVNRFAPRPGLRRWVAANIAVDERSRWKESWASIHHDGSATIATAIGEHKRKDGEYFEGWQAESAAIECAVADFMALVRTTAEATGNDEYDLRLGIDWVGQQPLTIIGTDQYGLSYDGSSTPLHRYTPVETTVNAVEPPLEFYWHVHNFAQDCVNQGGIPAVHMISPPDRDGQR